MSLSDKELKIDAMSGAPEGLKIYKEEDVKKSIKELKEELDKEVYSELIEFEEIITKIFGGKLCVKQENQDGI